jgi:hypothetical protein
VRVIRVSVARGLGFAASLARPAAAGERHCRDRGRGGCKCPPRSRSFSRRFVHDVATIDATRPTRDTPRGRPRVKDSLAGVAARGPALARLAGRWSKIVLL